MIMKKLKKWCITTVWVICWVLIVAAFFLLHCVNKALIWAEDSLRWLLTGLEGWAQDKLDTT